MRNTKLILLSLVITVALMLAIKFSANFDSDEFIINYIKSIFSKVFHIR